MVTLHRTLPTTVIQSVSSGHTSPHTSYHCHSISQQWPHLTAHFLPLSFNRSAVVTPHRTLPTTVIQSVSSGHTSPHTAYHCHSIGEQWSHLTAHCLPLSFNQSAVVTPHRTLPTTVIQSVSSGHTSPHTSYHCHSISQQRSHLTAPHTSYHCHSISQQWSHLTAHFLPLSFNRSAVVTPHRTLPTTHSVGQQWSHLTAHFLPLSFNRSAVVTPHCTLPTTVIQSVSSGHTSLHTSYHCHSIGQQWSHLSAHFLPLSFNRSAVVTPHRTLPTTVIQSVSSGHTSPHTSYHCHSIGQQWSHLTAHFLPLSLNRSAVVTAHRTLPTTVIQSVSIGHTSLHTSYHCHSIGQQWSHLTAHCPPLSFNQSAVVTHHCTLPTTVIQSVSSDHTSLHTPYHCHSISQQWSHLTAHFLPLSFNQSAVVTPHCTLPTTVIQPVSSGHTSLHTPYHCHSISQQWSHLTAHSLPLSFNQSAVVTPHCTLPTTVIQSASSGHTSLHTPYHCHSINQQWSHLTAHLPTRAQSGNKNFPGCGFEI